MEQLSLPPWERGLKSHRTARRKLKYVSLPPWERGLKSINPSRNFGRLQVAPPVRLSEN